MNDPYDPEHVTYFGETNYRNQQTRFGIKSRDRTRHMYVVGKSGVGKSTLLENMAIQDIANGHGVAVLDPHGSFAEKLLDYVPQHRIKDVIYFAPFDSEYPMSFNVLEDVGPEKRHLVVSGLMSTFKKIWVDAWSARMEYILSNTLFALLEYPGSTLLGVNRMLSDKDFRKKVVDNVTDSGVKAFWTDEFAKYTDKMVAESIPAIQNKVGQLTANPLIRNIIGQPKSSFDVRQIMDEKKILIINLSKGRIGEQNTNLLGSMIITKIYLAAMSRADLSYSRMADMPNFYFYVDEFQSFANETFANILSEARKYKLALIIAHQYIAQMEESVRDAVFGNVGTSLSFRVGPLDAELLEKVYAPQFVATDLINLGMAQVYLSLMINDIGSAPFSAKTLAPIPRPALSYRNDVIEWTRAHFALARDTVETNIKTWFGKDTAISDPSKAPDKQSDKPAAPPPVQAYVPKDPKAYQLKIQEKLQQQAQAPVSPPPAPEKKQEIHTPFKQALHNVIPHVTPKVVSQKPLQTPIPKDTIPKPTLIPPVKKEIPQSEETPTSVSPELLQLLNSLDAIEQKQPSTEVSHKPSIPSSVDTSTQHIPFKGEKLLSQSIAPVKHIERGATEQNKNLLREALMKATSRKDTDTSTGTSVPKQQPTLPPIPSQPPQQSNEISLKDLQKILE